MVFMAMVLSFSVFKLRRAEWMSVLPLAHYKYISSRFSRLLFLSICSSNISTFCSKFDSANRCPLSYRVFAILCQKMHFCLSLHPNRLGINACLFCLRRSIRIVIIPRRALPLVIIGTFNIPTFCSKFDWESVCSSFSLVFKSFERRHLFSASKVCMEDMVSVWTPALYKHRKFCSKMTMASIYVRLFLSNSQNSWGSWHADPLSVSKIRSICTHVCSALVSS